MGDLHLAITTFHALVYVSLIPSTCKDNTYIIFRLMYVTQSH